MNTPDPTSRAKVVPTLVIHPADSRYPRRMADTPGGWQIHPADGRYTRRMADSKASPSIKRPPTLGNSIGQRTKYLAN